MQMDVITEKILTAVGGFLELGMPIDAANELERLPPEVKNSTKVLKVCAPIYHAATAWAQLETVARELVKREPDEPGWRVSLAFAVRRSTDLVSAQKILLEAECQHPEDATIHFNLGCYACQLGDLEEAKHRIIHAIKIDPRFRAIALADRDLEPLWDNISTGL